MYNNYCNNSNTNKKIMLKIVPIRILLVKILIIIIVTCMSSSGRLVENCGFGVRI